MCGIFCYIGKQNKAGKIVIEGLKKLEYRGYDSWGLALNTKDNNVIVKKQVGKIGSAKINTLPDCSLGVGHTRWATHGGVTEINSHPHVDCSGNLAVIHNGIVENYEKIKIQLSKTHKFISETDTEIIIHLVEEYAKKLTFPEAVRYAFNDLEGLNAIVVANFALNSIVAVKKGSPLTIGYGKNEEYFISSDPIALLSHTHKITFLEDNEMAVIENNKLSITNASSKKSITPKIQTISWTENQTEKGKYKYFMIKEINEQPKLLRNSLINYDDRIRVLARKIADSDETLFIGCGTAYHAGLIGKYIMSLFADKKIECIQGSEMENFYNTVSMKTFPLFLSQSGETIDIIEVAGRFLQQGIQIGALVNRFGSTLYRKATYKFLLDAGPEICVLSTKSFTSKIAMLLLTGFKLSNRLDEGKNLIKSTATSIDKIVHSSYYKKYLKKLIPKISKSKHIFIIGRGISYPLALEAALKIKEVSYIHAEGFAGGELKHGVIALIEKGTPCIVFAPNDKTYNSAISNAAELKARGGFIIGISDKNNSIFDTFLPVDNQKEATIIPNIVVIQLISYYLALHKGLDPDKPRNLAKSVTVK